MRSARHIPCAIWITLVLAGGCMPTSRSLIERFETNRAQIESLRTELCVAWSSPQKGIGPSGEEVTLPFGGTIMISPRWSFPSLPQASLARFEDALNSVDANSITIGDQCAAYIGVWRGQVIDLRYLKFMRQGVAGYRYGRFDENANDHIAATDGTPTELPLGDGWVLETNTYTYIADIARTADTSSGNSR